MTDTDRFARLRCPDCGDTMEPGEITHMEHTSAAGPIIVEHLPALLCPQCGYSALSASAWQLLDQVNAERPAPVRTVAVPVYDARALVCADDLLITRRTP